MPPIIEAVGLRKSYQQVVALNGLDLVASAGEVTAVLGPNGAGKTTFVRAVATLIRPDSGHLRVAGVDALAQPRRVRQVIGLAGQQATVDPALTGRENLRMIGRLFGFDRRRARSSADAVLERLRLTEVADRLIRTYSGGMRRRLDLGASLVGSPQLLLLDEPTTGLDPRSRIEVWESVQDLVQGGTAVLLTTQYLEEADQLAKQVVIIDRGSAIATGTPHELKRRAGQEVVEVRPRRGDDLPGTASALAMLGETAPHVDAETRMVTLPVESGPEGLTRAVKAITELDIEIEDIALRRPTLDEVFLKLTGHTASPATSPSDGKKGRKGRKKGNS